MTAFEKKCLSCKTCKPKNGSAECETEKEIHAPCGRCNSFVAKGE